MSNKKIESIINFIEVAESNLRAARALLAQQGVHINDNKISKPQSYQNNNKSSDEDNALEVVEGYFDGESMVGDNGKVYVVPPNYASKTQLVVGDRMKWLLTHEREIYKLIAPAPRERVTGTFSIEGDDYLVLVDQFPNPVKILKASATYAMKNLALKIGDEVSIIIPKDTTPSWGAFASVVKSQDEERTSPPKPIQRVEPQVSELNEVNLDALDALKNSGENDYF